MPGSARFASLVLPHLDAGYNLARWLLHDAHDARDATQEACVRALRSIGNVRGDEARSWFLTIVRHACYDWMSRNPRPGPEAETDAAAGKREAGIAQGACQLGQAGPAAEVGSRASPGGNYGKRRLGRSGDKPGFCGAEPHAVAAKCRRIARRE